MQRLLIIFLIYSFYIHDAYSQESLQDSVIQAIAYPLDTSNGTFSGEGWDRLIARADTTDFVLFGENHGLREIADFANALYRKLSMNHPRILVTEIGPYTAIELERMVREGTYEEFMARGINLHSVPFFFLEQEVPLLKSTVEFNTGDKQAAIIGLDQEFIAGAPVVLSYLEKLAATEEEINAVRKAKRMAILNPFLIGMGSGSTLRSLEDVFKHSESEKARELTRQLVLSHKIYREQMGGDSKWSNERRETLMMENFEREVQTFSDSIPPMFFKFGSYHLHKNQSPTVDEALGLRVEEWASDRGLSTLNVFVDAKSGMTVDALMGGHTELPSAEIWQESAFSKFVNDSPVLFDLRSMQRLPEMNQWNNQIKYMLNGYDYLVLFPEGTPQDFLEGTLVTHRYGFIIGVTALLIISIIIYFLVQWIKKRKRRKTD
jgi:hypothetical protein